MGKDYLKVFNHEDKEIDLRHIQGLLMELRPIELHYNTNGDIEDNPAFCIVSELPGPFVTPKVYIRFSLNTIQKALAELGYTLYQP